MGKVREERERMELARWIAFRIYCQNPYVKEPKARTAQSYFRFEWEIEKPKDIEAVREGCKVTKEQQAILDNIIDETLNKRKQEVSDNG